MSGKTRKQQIEAMVAADPKDAFLRYALAMECVSEGDDAGAAALFQELLADSRDYVPAYLQSGQVLIRLGRTEEARRVLERGVTAARQGGEHHTAEEIQALLLTIGA